MTSAPWDPHGRSPAFTPLPADRPVRWGILATGGIAARFTRDLQLIPDDAAVAAVASRDLARAEAFAADHGIPRAHGSYEDLAADPEVDVVYVATPHSHHLAAAELCLRAGKHVLVEKPLTASPADTARLLDLAEQEGLFCMEAMWTRCNPLMRQLAGFVADGRFGAVRHVSCSFTFPFDGPPQHRLLNPALAGGAVLDLGVYPVHAALMLLGRPDRVSAEGSLTRTGVDGHAAALLRWKATDSRPSATASLLASLECGPAESLSVAFEHARVDFPAGFIAPRSMIVTTIPTAGSERESLEYTATIPGEGFGFEAQEVARCLRAGQRVSPLVPPEATRDAAGVLAAWRAGIDGGRGSGAHSA